MNKPEDDKEYKNLEEIIDENRDIAQRCYTDKDYDSALKFYMKARDYFMKTILYAKENLKFENTDELYWSNELKRLNNLVIEMQERRNYLENYDSIKIYEVGLVRAVSTERYEVAAQIRDKLKELKKTS